MATNFNTGPYFDDFNPDNQFYRVLFKPGYAVQARELNQLQSILQHQVSSVGNHLFKKNAVVIPGGIAVNTVANIVSITNINDPSVLVGKTITNATSFDYTDDATLDGYITAIVLGYTAATSSAPAALYVKYFKTQTDGRGYFNQSEQLKTVDASLLVFDVDSTIGSTIGKVATISAGTFFTKTIFVDSAQQSIILEVDSGVTTNCTVGLSIIESIVTSDDDQTLLDNANGAPNQYAPGADRYKIDLVLNRIDLSTTIDDELFIKMLSIENNVITYINNKTQYAELMTMLARRTYDANGNFIVRGLDTSITRASDDAFVWANVTGGKCYLGGYEYEQLVTTPVVIEKPRDAFHQAEVGPVTKYTSGMTYFYVAGGTLLKEIPLENSLVQFLNAAPGTPGASVVGYGIFKNMQFEFGTTGVNDVYKMFFDYISLEKGYSIADIGGIKAITASQGAPVLHAMRISNATGAFTAGNTIASTTNATQTGLMYQVVNTFVYVIKNTLFEVPSTDIVKDSTTGATAVRATTYVTNYDSSSIPMIEVDTDVVKTLYNSSGINTTSYSNIQVNSFVVTGVSTLTVNLTGDDIFDEYSTSSYFAYITTSGSEKFVDLTNLLTISGAGKRYEISVLAGSPMIGNTVIVFSTVNKVNVSEALKTLTTVTAGSTIATPSSSWMALGHQDVVEIKKVVDSQTVSVSAASWISNVATITTDVAHGINIGEVVVVRNILSSNNLVGSFNSGFNGKFTVTGVTSTTFTVANNTSPGTYDVNSDGTVALPPDINSDADITSRFILDSGNTAYLSGCGMIKLKRGSTAPQGQIAIQYTYYAIGTGGYVSVDSYGLYTNSDLSYIGNIPDLLGSQNNTVEARRYIDFRTRPSNYYFKNIGSVAAGSSVLILRDLNLSYHATTLMGKYVVGPSHLNGATISLVTFNPLTGNTELTLSATASAATSGTYYIGLYSAGLSLTDVSAGAKSFNRPKDDSRLTYQYFKFLPKHVMVYINRDTDVLKVDYKEISGKMEAINLQRNEFKLPLAYIYMKPYTVSVQDVTLEKFENPVYQMLDIHNIKKRVDRNDYYTSLALNRNIHQEIVDVTSELQTTASRGIWAEDFMDVMSQDYNSDDYACTIYDKSYAAPGVVTRTLTLELDSSLNTSTWQRTGTAITLPYQEAKAFGNAYASRSNNLNPFNMINWSGKLVLNPSVDNWVDTTVASAQTVNNTASPSTVSSSTSSTSTATVSIPTPLVLSLPPSVLPQPPVEELVTQINNLRVSWGPDSAGGRHAITFDWVTNLGKTGRVNTDMHLSSAINTHGYDGTYAKSLINKRYNETGVKEYLNAGVHFDQVPPSKW